MAEHTPGPWQVMSDDGGLYILMEKNMGKDEYLAIYAAENPEQREADVYIIAAAPALLSFAQYVMDYCNDPHVVARAKKEIAKARGEQ